MLNSIKVKELMLVYEFEFNRFKPVKEILTGLQC